MTPLRSILDHSWVLYAGLFLFIWIMPTHTKLIANAKAQTLSRLTPPMDYFAQFVDKKGSFDKKKIDDCIDYHRQVVSIIRAYRADGYAMLGFCYERKGQYDKALSAYERSVAQNPSYFWTHYNIGALYYNKKNYEKARYHLERATEQDPVRASLIPEMSKVYKDVIASKKGKPFDVAASLSAGYQTAFTLLVLCSKQLHNYPLMFATAMKVVERGRPEDNVFYYYAASAAYEMKMFDKSVVLLQRFLSAAPTSPEGMHDLGLSLRAMGREEEAKHVLLRADQLAAQYGPSLPDLSHAPVQFF